MRRFIIPVACLALLFTSTAFAGSATGLLFQDGTTVNILEDQDYESIIDRFDANGRAIVTPVAAPTLDVGDQLFGIFAIEAVRPDPALGRPNNAPTTNAFTAVFYLEVTGKVFAAGKWNWTFGAVTTAEWTTLGFAGVMDTGTVAVVYDDNIIDDAPNWIDPADTDIATSLQTVNGTRLWEVGFDGVAGEFWEAQGPSDVLAAYINSSGGVAPDELRFNANLDVTHDYGANVLLLPHDHLVRGRGTHQWQIAGVGEQVDTGFFDLGTDSNLYIVATPEPASIALLGLGLLGVGGVVIRRRRRA